MFETVLHVVSSLDQPNASTFAQINVTIHQDYSITTTLSAGRLFRMCAVIGVLLVAVV
jgi:hypothetical protein